jgi:hypothetical protein
MVLREKMVDFRFKEMKRRNGKIVMREDYKLINYFVQIQLGAFYVIETRIGRLNVNTRTAEF